MPRILILGAPGSGKTTLSRGLFATDPQMRPVQLDDDISRLVREQGWSSPLTDDQIGQGVASLLTRASGTHSCVVELAHHDYISLLQQDRVRLEDYDQTVLLVAPLGTLLSRNLQRTQQVPNDYIARCFGAVTALVEYLSWQNRKGWFAIDTTISSLAQVQSVLADILRHRHGSRLHQLAIAPVPANAHLGGHFLHTVEWSDALIAELLARYDIRTALDVGCGIGTSIDRFQAIGVQCWGIEGNAAVLGGPSRFPERIWIADLTKQSVQLPIKVDLVWCVEVLEHIPDLYIDRVLRTIVDNTRRLVFASAAPPGQPGYFHVNCRPRDEWIARFEQKGLVYVPETPDILACVSEEGPFGASPLRSNGMIFEVKNGR